MENTGSVDIESQHNSLDQPWQSEASRILTDGEIFSNFLQVLKASLKIEGKDAYKIVKIRNENRPEGLKNITEVAFLEKAKCILKHNIHKTDPFCSFCLKIFRNPRDKNDHIKMVHEKSVEKKFSL